jgi:hypothetical protein
MTALLANLGTPLIVTGLYHLLGGNFLRRRFIDEIAGI